MGEEPTTILVVDDDPDLREVLAEFLADEGFGVRTAGSGAEALASVAATGAPTLVLIDMMMPDMDGEEVVRALAARAPSTRVVVMTALPTQRDRDRFSDCRIDAFLAKPLKLETLRTTIRGALKGPARC